MELFYTETSKRYKGVTFYLYAEVDAELPVRGNAISTGNDREDKECEDAILERLSGGNIWAWARVKVEARRGDHVGEDFLCGCSYEDYREFIRPGSYYTDMKKVALDDLRKKERG